MPRQTASASDYTSLVRSSAVANDVASKPVGSRSVAKAFAAAVRGGGSLGAIGTIVRQSVVAKSIAPLPVRASVTVVPVLPLSSQAGTDAFLVSYDSSGVGLWSAKIASSTNDDIGFGVTTDVNGNIYVTGRAGNTGLTVTAYNADGTPFGTTITATMSDSFIIKYNSNGVVQWFIKLGSSTISAKCIVEADQSGNVYAFGQYRGAFKPFNSDGSQFSKTLDHSGAGAFIFIVKYNATGFVQWCARLTTNAFAGIAESCGISIDSNNDVFITGAYGANGDPSNLVACDLNDSAFATVLANNGTTGNDAFIVKYSSGGSVLWVAKVASTGVEISQAISTDSNGNAYIVGQGPSWQAYSSNGTPFGTAAANSGSSDIFLVKYNSSGIVQWATRIGSSAADIGYAIASDSSGNIYITGQAGSNTTFFNSDSSSFATAMTSLGSSEAFVAKYNTSGIAQWTAKVASTSVDVGYGITLDSNGNVYMTGEFSTNPSADARVRAFSSNGQEFAKTLTNAGSSDAVVVKFNSSGIVQWLARVAGSGADIGRAIAVDKNSGKIYVSGQFTSSPLTMSDAA